MARRITELTRRSILDHLLAEKINLYGCYDEIDFLSRLWDLDAMRSSDPRFNNAAGDIWQHRINNIDWEDGWLFYDARFGLMDGDDALFLRFLCEILHPDVRLNATETGHLHELCNKLLQNDGYALLEKSQPDGRSVYISQNIGASRALKQAVLMGLERSVYTRIVRLVLAEKAVDYVFQEVDIFAPHGAPNDYKKHHPFVRIPAFQDGDFTLYETTAITRYIDEAFAGLSLQPDVLLVRARMNQIISVMDAYAYRPMVGDVLADEAVINTCLNELDSWLGEQCFLCSDQLTLADLHTAPILHYFAQTPEGERMLASRIKLRDWLQRMQARPSMQATQSAYG